MFITKQELIDLNACETWIDRFIEQTNNTDKEYVAVVFNQLIY